MKSRIISGVIALVYVIGAYVGGGGGAAIKVAAFLVLPLACIWFSDTMGGYTGFGMGRGAITSTSPGCMVAICGWVLLLLPVIIGVIMVLNKNQ